jgi:hypothetical protein
MGAGGPPHAQLSRLHTDYPLSVHGVGLSIGSTQAIDQDHLRRLNVLCKRYEPESFSGHLAWSSHDGIFLNDLLPLPYTEATLGRVVEHIDLCRACSVARCYSKILLPIFGSKRARSRRPRFSRRSFAGRTAVCCLISTMC